MKVSTTDCDYIFVRPEAILAVRDRVLFDERNSISQGNFVEMRFAKHVSFGERKPRASQGTRMRRNLRQRLTGEGDKEKEEYVATFYIQDQLTVQLRSARVGRCSG